MSASVATSSHTEPTSASCGSTPVCSNSVCAAKRPSATDSLATPKAKPSRKNTGSFRSFASLMNMSHSST